jgi:hypothetical protein
MKLIVLLSALALPMFAGVKPAAPGFPVGSLEDQTATCIAAGGPVGACVHAVITTNPELITQRVIETYHPPADVKSAALGYAAGSVEDQVATCITAGGLVGACTNAVMPWRADCDSGDRSCLTGYHSAVYCAPIYRTVFRTDCAITGN